MADDLDFDELFDNDARDFDPASSPLGSQDDTDFDDDFEDQFRSNGEKTALIDLSSDPFEDRSDRFDDEIGKAVGEGKQRRSLWRRGRSNRSRQTEPEGSDFPDILADPQERSFDGYADLAEDDVDEERDIDEVALGTQSDPPPDPPPPPAPQSVESDSLFDMLDDVEELTEAELVAVLAGLEDDDEAPESHDDWWVDAEVTAEADTDARSAPPADPSTDLGHHDEPPSTATPEPAADSNELAGLSSSGGDTGSGPTAQTEDDASHSDATPGGHQESVRDRATPISEDVAASATSPDTATQRDHDGTESPMSPTQTAVSAGKRYETRSSRDRFPLNVELSEAVSDLVERAWSTGLGRFVFVASDNHVQRRALIESIGAKYRGRDDLPTISGTVSDGVFIGDGSPSSEAHTLMRQLTSLIDEGLDPFTSLLTALIDLNSSSQALARSLITAGQPQDVLSLIRVLLLAAAGEGPVVLAIDRADRSFGNWWHILAPTLASDALERHPILVFIGIDGAPSANASQQGFPPEADVASRLVLDGKAEWWAVAALSNEDIRRWTGSIARDVLDRLVIAGGRESRATASIWETWISRHWLTTAKADGRWVVSASTAIGDLHSPELLPDVDGQLAAAAAIMGAPWKPDVFTEAFGVSAEAMTRIAGDGQPFAEPVVTNGKDAHQGNADVRIASDALAATLRSGVSQDEGRDLLHTLLNAWKPDATATGLSETHDRARLARTIAEPATAEAIEGDAALRAQSLIAPIETGFYLAQVGQQSDAQRHVAASIALERASLETAASANYERALEIANGARWHAGAAQRADIEAGSLATIARLTVRMFDLQPVDGLVEEAHDNAANALEMAISADATYHAAISNLVLGQIARRQERLDDAEISLRTALDLMSTSTTGQPSTEQELSDRAEATFELALVRWAQGAQNDAAALAADALEGADHLNAAQRAPLHHLLGAVALHNGDSVAARTHLEQALTLREQVGDEEGGSETLRLLGIVASRSGEREQADAYFADAARVARRVARGSDLEALAIAERGEHLVRFGDTDEGIGALEAAHRMAQRLDDTELQTRVGSQIVDALMTRAAKRRNTEGDQAAIDSSRKALEYARGVADPQRTMLALIELADTRLALDQLDAVEPLIAEALELTESRGDAERLDHARAMAATLARRRATILLATPAEPGVLDGGIEQRARALAFERLRGDNSAIALDGYKLALLYDQRGDVDEAEALLRESLSLWSTAGDQASASQAMQRLAEISLAKGDLDDAERMLTDAFEIRRNFDDQVPRIETQTAMAQVYQERYNRALDAGDLNEAISNLERLADISGEIRDEERMAQSLHELGSLQMRLGDDIAAQIAFDRAEQLRISLDDEVGLRATRLAQIDLRQHRASRLAASLELGEAATATAEGIAIAEVLGDKTQQANMHAAAGAIAKQAGDDGAARVEYRQAAQLFRDENRPGPSAQALLEVGLIELADDDLDNAEPHLNEANELAKSAGVHATMASARHALGVAAVSRGDRDGAQQQFEAALEIRRSIGDKGPIVQTLTALRVVLFEKGESALRGGRLEVAGKDLERALEMARELGDAEATADALHSLGVLSLRRGKPTDAQSYLTEALSISKTLGRSADMAATYHALGDLYLRVGQLTDAERNLEEALRIRRELDDPERTADTLHTLGVLHLNRDAEDTSEGYFAEALALRESIDDTRDAATTLHALGALHVRSAKARMTTDRLGARLRLELAEQRLKAASDIRRELNDIRGAEQSEGLMAEARTLFDDAQPALPR